MAANAAIGAVTSNSSERSGIDDLKQSACLLTRHAPLSAVKNPSWRIDTMAACKNGFALLMKSGPVYNMTTVNASRSDSETYKKKLTLLGGKIYFSCFIRSAAFVFRSGPSIWYHPLTIPTVTVFLTLLRKPDRRLLS